ncbi:hypothetical protein DV096_12885 [Bradymonadaceae bacterium TMQ3]|nr:hypothetical protein DV096_12885 [Bradymonadaceae bacterium TMQ3]TXC74962.1 hypothetical protein FRC91_12760 [Bradymonadales bacterium TMQ1]
MKTEKWKWVVGFFAALVLADLGVGMGLRALSAKVRTGAGMGQVRAAVEGEPIDLLVLGSSRARHHIDTDWLGDELGIRALNLGANGQGTYYAYMVLAMLVEAGQVPDAVLLQVEPRDLRDPRLERARVLTPGYDGFEVMRRELPKMGKWAGVKLWSATYRYNHRVFEVVRHALFPPAEVGTGFVGRVGAFRHVEAAPFDAEGARIDGEGWAFYEAFVELATEQGIEVVIFEGPRLRAERDVWESRAAEALEGLAADHPGVVWEAWDEARFEGLEERSLWYDPGYLNAEGARRFTALISDTPAFRSLGAGR